jgi:hypothetical protein
MTPRRRVTISGIRNGKKYFVVGENPQFMSDTLSVPTESRMTINVFS